YQTLSQFSTSLVTRLDLKSLTEEIVRRLAEVMSITTASLYLLDQEKDLYLLAASHRLNVDPEKAPRFMTGDWLPHYLASTHASWCARSWNMSTVQARCDQSWRPCVGWVPKSASRW
ncbi:MAG: hypothetical protein ACREIO_03095, partial [Nitrospiraceae bacterium]